LLAVIPLLIPVVAADGEGALTIVIIGGMPARRLDHDHRQVPIVIMVALMPAKFLSHPAETVSRNRAQAFAIGRPLGLSKHPNSCPDRLKDRLCRSADIRYYSI
jgi:hypothetical protein